MCPTVWNCSVEILYWRPESVTVLHREYKPTIPHRIIQSGPCG